MEIALTGLGLLLLALTWKYVWLPTALDTARDRLFDLRDREVRAWFVQNEISLDHPVYISLRELLNGMLKNTESLTIMHIASLVAWSKANPELDQQRRKGIEERFSTDDKRIKNLVDGVREKASMIMLDYVVESSLMMFVFAFFALIFFVPMCILKVGKAVLRNGFNISPVFRTRLAAIVLSIVSTMGLASRATAQATVEEKAFSMHCSA